MSRTAAIRLVKSLSKSEKRQFKMRSKRQSGDKDYLALFNLIEESDILDEEIIRGKFEKDHPRTSLDGTAAYLVKVLTDSLIQSKVREDNLSHLLYGLLRFNLLKERNLLNDAYKELKRLQKIAEGSQLQLLQHIMYRYELNYLTEINFQDVSERQLVGIQMKARDLLKDTRNTQEHYALYELLKCRLVHSGQILSDSDKRKINDLLLSEMSIVNARVKNTLESRKLHLLFQSFFFTDIGDYASALKTFRELNRLFERNVTLWHHPPMDYYSALEGILDSLRVMGRFKEMDFYIQKLENLDVPQYPEYFRFIVRKSVMNYRLTFLLNLQESEEAVKLVDQCDPGLLKAYSLVDVDRQHELLFSMALTWFIARDFKKAHKCISGILLLEKVDYQSMIYRASRLLNILIYYEKKDFEYLDYEIRSYKRALKGRHRLLEMEKLVFKVIRINPDFNNTHKNDLLWTSLKPLVQRAEGNKYELQLRKYFDFTGWSRGKFAK
jgi:hypothetical protein